eukprot:TRINITY_DN8690_c0_g1_i1.p2 TRINITY_DN8690_c0_g1~~TRINITY_DN8690_c0_g1_i1.p2  ORF type:complete len:760 (+),score=-5.99 TRINITY_DN8690_c0_g1_i1:96-2375(+)
MVGGALAADADVLALLVGGGDGHGQQGLDRRVPLVEEGSHQAGVTIQAQGQLGQVVGADGEAVEHFQELVGQQGVGGNLAHHDQLEIVLALLEAVFGQQADHALAFIDGAHEGHHQFHVGQAHFFADLLHGPAFHLETVAEGAGDVAGGATEAQHGVFFLGLVEVAAQQLAVLVGLEVGETHDDGLGPEGGGDGGDPLGQLLDEEFHRIGVTPGATQDLFPLGGGQTVDFQDGLGVDADDVVDDELDPGQADAGVGQLGELEGQLRVAHVHHDLGLDLGHGAQVAGSDLEVQLAAIDVTGVAFGAGDGDHFTFGQGLGGVTATDDGGDAQFPGDDGGVAGTAATVGDDGGSPLHHRLPVGIGHVGHQHVAGLDLVHLGRIMRHAHRADADLLADGAAGGQHLGEGLELELLDAAMAFLGLHGLGAGLQDVQLAVHAVLAPLDVHGTLVVLFDDHGVAGQLFHFGIVDGEAVTLGLGHVLGDGGLAGHLLGGEGHLDQLGTQVAADHGLLAGGQHGLVHVELVRVHGALHHGLAQAIGGGDEDGVAEAGFGIQGEHHAGGALVGTHHALHAGGQGHLGVGEALVHAVGNGAVVIEGGEHFLHGVKDVVEAMDVEEGFLLASEGSVGQVLGGGGGAHGEGGVGGGIGDQGVVVGLDLVLQLGRERGVDDPLANLGAGSQQGIDVVHVQVGEFSLDAGGQAFMGQELPIGMGRGGETAGNPHTGIGQLADHFAERGVLAADTVHICHAQLVETDYIIAHEVL